MNTLTINVKFNEDGSKPWLSSIFAEGVPTNTVIDKACCGIGLTYSEIIAQRNSLIITPYTSQCINKASQHKAENLLAVTKGVTSEDVADYILKSLEKDNYLKIITVPEDLFKVEEACVMVGIKINSAFFIFLDECQHQVANTDWRKMMLHPLELFFAAAQKAMASATPLGMSDPWFETQGFTFLKIEPEWETKIDTKLICTNNVLQSLKYQLSQLDAQRKKFLFSKSVRVIMAMIEGLGVKDESAVFCAPDTVQKLKHEHYKTAYSDFNAGKLTKFNFFTARFFDSIDMKIDEQPDVIVVSDVVNADFSWLNPTFEAFQIHGRCRNGVNTFCVISNYSDNFCFTSKEEAQKMIDFQQQYWEQTRSYMGVEEDPIIRRAFGSILKSLPFNDMLDGDGEPSSFLIDNYVENQVAKGCYTNQYCLLDAYENSGRYNIDFLNQWWPIGDYEYLQLKSPSVSARQKRMEIVRQIISLGEIDSDMKQSAIEELRAIDPDTVEAYEVLGAEIIDKLKFSKKKMKEAVILANYKECCSSSQFYALINNSFPTGNWYEPKYIKKELKRIHELLGITPPKAITGSMICDLFYTRYVKRTRNGKQIHVYLLDGKKF